MDADPGSGAFFAPGTGTEEFGSAKNISDPQNTLTGTYLDNVGEGYFLDNVPAVNIKEEEGRVAGLCQEDLRVILVEPPGNRDTNITSLAVGEIELQTLHDVGGVEQL